MYGFGKLTTLEMHKIEFTFQIEKVHLIFVKFM